MDKRRNKWTRGGTSRDEKERVDNILKNRKVKKPLDKRGKSKTSRGKSKNALNCLIH